MQQDWLRFDGEKQLREHMRLLTPELRARSPMIREEARASVATFVRGWLLGRAAHEAGIRDVRVVFADEGEGERADGGAPIEAAAPGR